MLLTYIDTVRYMTQTQMAVIRLSMCVSWLKVHGECMPPIRVIIKTHMAERGGKPGNVSNNFY